MASLGLFMGSVGLMPVWAGVADIFWVWFGSYLFLQISRKMRELYSVFVNN